MTQASITKENSETKISQPDKEPMARYRRAVNYLAAAQIYLKANTLLSEPLRPEHIKDRLLGHWGTAPGINLIYTHLNYLIKRTAASVLLVTGPGHGAAANMANMFVEGTLTEFYPEVTYDRAGIEKLCKLFSWPYGFPSHLSPALPGVIHEGGELGYALATAFGAAFDNPDLIVACIIGDGEAETGPTAGAWHSNKFLNPATDGAVLPILHLNGFKISNPTIFGTMNDEELNALFTGYGYAVRTVNFNAELDEEMQEAVDWAYREIRAIQGQARYGQPPHRPQWPLIILRTPKGFGCPAEIDGEPVAGTFRAHQIPVKDPKNNPVHLAALEKWLRSYQPEELFDDDGKPAPDILSLCLPRDQCIAMNQHSFGGACRTPLNLPDLSPYALKIAQRGGQRTAQMNPLSEYLKDVILLNQEQRNFRLVCPDELESNRIGKVLEATNRQYTWPLPANTEHTARDGRVLEMLSEHNCQGWLQGYLLTGRHGLYPCYEAFIPIVDGMMNQYAKFLKTSLEIPWRKPIASLNYLLTSEVWRQDHNGYSHQGPGFINSLLTRKGTTYRIYLPPDANSLLSTIDHCLHSTNYINLVIAGKQPMPQWLSLDEAIEHCRVGTSIWRWASTNNGDAPEIVLAAGGDNMTLEVMAAAKLLREELPELKVRVVNVTDLMALGVPEKYPHGLSEDRFQRIFPLACPVIFNFHGYTSALKQLLWERPQNDRFAVNGYREEGSTTTPFDMMTRNKCSRYHIVMQTAAKLGVNFAVRAEELIRKYEGKLREHRAYVQEKGIDPPEIANFQWE